MRKSTQSTLKFKRIEDGILEMEDGGIRTALIVSSTNFALKSAEEQEAQVASYASFLNSLGFPIQIVVQSRILDLSEYIKKIEEAATNQTNPLLRQQTLSYILFIQELVSGGNIMNKNFYVIVPFSTSEMPGVKKLFNRHQKEKAVEMLIDRTAVVSSGLASIGLLNAQLNTQEMVELFYRTLNGEVAHREKIYNLDDLQAPVIKAQAGKKEIT